MPADPTQIVNEPGALATEQPLFPTALLAAGTGCVMLMMVLLVPKFERIFANFSDLPAMTKALLSASRWVGGRLYPDQVLPGLFYLAALLPAIFWGGLWCAWRLGWAKSPVLLSERTTPWVWGVLGLVTATFAASLLLPVIRVIFVLS